LRFFVIGNKKRVEGKEAEPCDAKKKGLNSGACKPEVVYGQNETNTFIVIRFRCNRVPKQNELFFNLLVVLVGNLVSCLRVKLETKSVTPDTAFRFNSKDDISTY
jgi:hypothetical protein